MTTEVPTPVVWSLVGVNGVIAFWLTLGHFSMTVATGIFVMIALSAFFGLILNLKPRERNRSRRWHHTVPILWGLALMVNLTILVRDSSAWLLTWIVIALTVGLAMAYACRHDTR